MVSRLVLSDGRALAWREYGNRAGFPILFFHGNLNSRLFSPAWDKSDQLTSQSRARLIAVDRPGYGESDFLQDRTYLSWAHDVQQLAAQLQLPRFAVLGYSSGGPNAMACGAVLGPTVVAAVGLISTDGPYTRIPGMMKRMFGTSNGSLELTAATDRARVNAAEMREAYAAIKKPDRRQLCLDDLSEAVKQGYSAAGQDGVLESRDWGFSTAQVSHEGVLPVLGWHGTDDLDVPVEAARFVAENVPGAKMKIIEGENHTLLRRHWESILCEVVSAAEKPSASKL